MIWNREAETMPREQRQALQLERLKATVRRAYDAVSFTRQAFDAAGVSPDDLQQLDDLNRLPFTKKTDLRENYPFGLFAVPLDQVVRLHASSGTKGKPTVVGYTRDDVQMWAECCARSIALAGGQPGDVLHNGYGYGLFTGGLGLHYGGEHMGCTVVPVSGGNTPRQILLIQDFQPRGIACTPSYFLNLVEAMREQGIDPKGLSLRYGIFGAEPWTDAMRQQLEQETGIDACDIYGLSEVMGPGVSCECREAKDGLHIQEDHFLAEILDPQSGQPLPAGQTGELVFTSLSKQAFPVVRYRTGDLSCLMPEPCVCGRTTARMGRVKGRVDDMMIIRGVNVFPSEVEATILAFAELTPYYQLVLDRVRALDEVTLVVEVSEPFYQRVGGALHRDEQPDVLALEQRLGQALKDAHGVTFGLDLQPPKSVVRSEGKAVRLVDRRPR